MASGSLALPTLTFIMGGEVVMFYISVFFCGCWQSYWVRGCYIFAIPGKGLMVIFQVGTISWVPLGCSGATN